MRFDFTHPTSFPLSLESGSAWGKVIVVALVQTVVPLCKTSLPSGFVKPKLISLLDSPRLLVG